MEATTTIAAIKQEVRLREWSAQIEAQRASNKYHNPLISYFGERIIFHDLRII